MLQSKNCKRHYFSIESILATEEQMPCTFIKNEPFIGFLELGSVNDKISAGTSLQLPYWIASCFVPYPRNVNVELPKHYNRTFREILKADASVVDLKTLNKFYYISAKHLMKLHLRESHELKSVLIQSFRKRFRKIMDWSQNGATDQIKGLDWSESNIFEVTKKAQDNIENWIKGDNSIIKASAMIVSHKKRKLANSEII